MGRTRGKLNEAKFFLQELEKDYMKHPECDYYLSAFFSSARSVAWVMRNEYDSVEGWEAWYDARKPTSDEELLLTIANRIRVRTTKKGPLETRGQIAIHVPPQPAIRKLEQGLKELAGKPLKVAFRPLRSEDSRAVAVGEESVQFTGRLEKVYRVLDEFPDDDILELCREYVSVLEALVADCESRFALQDT